MRCDDHHCERIAANSFAPTWNWSVTFRVMQYGPAGLRKAEVAKAALQVLVERGLLLTEGDGRYRVAANPEAADGTAEADRSPATAK